MSALIIVLSLGIGTAGYHFYAGLRSVDSLLNASMILTGMGPVSALTTDAAKLFASGYALYSGIVFLAATGVMVAPFLHRVLHRMHVPTRRCAENRERSTKIAYHPRKFDET